MTNKFLSVNKDLFKLKLNPTEILLLAQVMEYNRTTGDFFMGDDVLAENFGVSSKTISRSLKALEEKGYICRATKNTKGGKERHITSNITVIEDTLKKIEEQTAKDKLTVDGGEKEEAKDSQRTNCPLPTDKLSLAKGQNDFIKDKRIDKVKDNSMDEMQSPKEEVETSSKEEALTEVSYSQAVSIWGDEFIINGNILTFKEGTLNYGKKYRVIGD